MKPRYRQGCLYLWIDTFTSPFVQQHWNPAPPLHSNRWPLRARRTPGLAEWATNRYNSDARRIAAYIAWSFENTGYQEPVPAPGLYFEGRLPSISHRLRRAHTSPPPTTTRFPPPPTTPPPHHSS